VRYGPELTGVSLSIDGVVSWRTRNRGLARVDFAAYLVAALYNFVRLPRPDSGDRRKLRRRASHGTGLPPPSARVPRADRYPFEEAIALALEPGDTVGHSRKGDP
jgi:hypothetical protein